MKRFLKYTGYGFAALILLIVLVYGVFHICTNMAINRVYAIEPAVFTIPTDSSAIAWGGKLVLSFYFIAGETALYYSCSLATLPVVNADGAE